MTTCRLPGCSRPVATPASHVCQVHQDHHTPLVIGRTPTHAANVTACPACGGAVKREGTLVSCRRRPACGWSEFVSRAVRAPADPSPQRGRVRP
jgi:hypothetical protein